MGTAFKRVLNAELSVGGVGSCGKLSAENCNELLLGGGLNIARIVKGSNGRVVGDVFGCAFNAYGCSESDICA